jgi:GGDEF domain-containing protein
MTLERSPQMTRHTPSPISLPRDDAERAAPLDHAPLALLEVAASVAEGARKLVPSCTATVAVELGSAWQLLAQCGNVDVASDWRGALAVGLPSGERAQQGDGYAVSAFPSSNLRALLILLAEPETEVPTHAHASLRTLLDEGGALLDDALAVQQRDRAVRRVTLLEHARRQVRPSRVTDDVEDAISSLWPCASVHFHDLDEIRDAPWSTRGLVQTSYDLDRLVVDDAPGSGLLPADLSYRVAIPFRSRRGAFLVQPWAGGEDLDIESVAAASAVARTAELLDRQHALTTEIRTLRREDPETGCSPGDALALRLTHALETNHHGDVAVVLVEIEPSSESSDGELHGFVGQALADAVRRDRAEIFRVSSRRFAVVLVGTSARDARLVAQRLHLAARTASDEAAGTVAVGVALAPVHGTTAMELIDAAEQAMRATAAVGGDPATATERGRRYATAVDVFQRVEALRTLKTLADQACHGGLAHSDAVAERAVRIATAMHLEHEVLLAVQLAGELHEIGSLLLRDGALSDAAAVTLAGRMIRACGLPEAATIVESMYERFDGSWIPLGRAGQAIPIGARILAVADHFETALEGRSAADAMAAAVTSLEAQSGRSLDPHVIEVALRTREQHRAGRLPLAE